MKRPSFTWMITGGCVLVAVLALNTYLNFRNTTQLNNDAYWVEHTYLVINGLDEVAKSAVEAESSGRGFLVTGDDQYISQYRTSIEAADTKLDRLEEFTRDNPDQQARFPELRQILRERFGILDETIEARKAGGIEAIKPFTQSGRGRVASERLQTAIEEMKTSERRLLIDRSTRAKQTYWVAVVTELAAGVIAILCVIAFLILLRRFLRARTEAAFVIAEQAERLRTTLASIGDAVITTDTNARITNMNAVAEAVTGWTKEQAADQPLEDVFKIVNEATREVVESPVARSLREGAIVGLANHTVLLTRDGREVPIDDSAAPIRCKEDEVVGCVLVFRDVSQRRREDSLLREMHSRLESTLSFGEIGTWEFDLKNDIIRADANLAKMFDLTSEQAAGGSFEVYLRSIHPDDAARVKAETERVIEGGERYDMEYRVVDPAGKIRWIMARGRVERDDEGRAVRLPGVVVDITRSKRAEENVRRLETSSERERRLFYTAISNTADFIYTFDLNGKFTYINQSLLDLLQKTLDEAVGKNFFELDYPPELAQRLQDQIQEVITTGKTVRDETPYTSHKGERQYEYIFVPVFGEGGAVEAVAGSTRDITDRKETEATLRESEKRMRQLADAMPQIVWAARPDGELDYYNMRWFEYIDVPPDDLEAAAWANYVHPDDLPRAEEQWARSVESGNPYSLEFRVRSAAGEYRWFLARALAVRDVAGTIVRWYGTCTDINEEVERANELRNVAARLSEADRRKNEFLAMLAHELRNPLAPIRNALQIVRITGANHAELETATAMMDRQVGQLVRLVDDLLDISRISSGKIDLRKGKVDVNQVISAAVEAARPEFQRKKIELLVGTLPDPIYVNGDSARLVQTVGNLLNNARKFTDREGSVIVTTSINDANQVVLSVRDTGIGIAANQLPYIFDLFVQADTSLERSSSGLGIGLSLVKNLVEMHDGTVEARSGGLGHGTEFIITLPLLAGQFETASETGSDSGELKAKARRRVLVVDDNVDSAESLSLLLEIAGHEVTTAKDGVEAVDEARRFRPDVVLLDIGLPRLNGYEAAREIRGHDWGASMTLIALTGWGQQEDRERSKAAGFDKHMVKPVDHNELMKFLDNLDSK